MNFFWCQYEIKCEHFIWRNADGNHACSENGGIDCQDVKKCSKEKKKKKKLQMLKPKNFKI